VPALMPRAASNKYWVSDVARDRSKARNTQGDVTHRLTHALMLA